MPDVMPLTTGAAAGERMTRPDYGEFGYFGGWGAQFGIVPRRGSDPLTASWLNGARERPACVRDWLFTAPHRFLQTLCETHPLFKQARANDLGLAFSPDDIAVVAVAPGQSGRDAIDGEATAQIDDLWANLPRELGGLPGLLTALYDQSQQFGACFVECVPAARGGGLAAVYTVDPLTVRFRDTEAGRVLEQRQIDAPNGWRELDQSLCLYIPLDGTSDNPYGFPGRMQAMWEGARDLHDQGNLDEVIEQCALPRLTAGFPLNSIVQYAKENPEVLTGKAADGGDLTASEYAVQMFTALTELMSRQSFKKVFVRLEGTEVKTISGADSLKALDSTFEARRMRLISALDQLPTLMGADTGGTLAYSSTQFMAQAKKLERKRNFILAVAVMIAALHLRLLGTSLTARADVEPIRASEAFQDEQARQLQILNEQAIFRMGLTTGTDMAHALTRSGIADEARFQEWASTPAAPPPVATPPDNGGQTQ